MKFKGYETGGFYDEMFTDDGRPRPGAELLVSKIEALPTGELNQRQAAAERVLHNSGITFNVYDSDEGAERVLPFDILPRVIASDEWERVDRGLKQRIHAINLFIDDIYNDQKVVRNGVFPAELLASAKGYLKECVGLKPPRGIWCHITGTDLVRDRDGTFYVLEDNLRVPSGVSYVLANRDLMKRTFPEVFARSGVHPVADYPERLMALLQYIAPPQAGEKPVIGVLTPGIFNSAYFEHSFLAQRLGTELVEGRDLVCMNDRVCMRTTHGLTPVDVLYRRVGDEFLDPLAFRSDSTLGVAGLMDVYRKGRLGLANAPGTGVADDKVTYAFVPRMIKYYLGEEAILPNVPTHLCYKKKELEYTLAHLDELVVKPANEAGGYGILVGPYASSAERHRFAELIRANPRNYISQPTLALSRTPVIVNDVFEGRHVDLRPFILHGEETYVLPGGLTRVALKAGSLVVNSSQGGGSKDTWVVETMVG